MSAEMEAALEKKDSVTLRSVTERQQEQRDTIILYAQIALTLAVLLVVVAGIVFGIRKCRKVVRDAKGYIP